MLQNSIHLLYLNAQLLWAHRVLIMRTLLLFRNKACKNQLQIEYLIYHLVDRSKRTIEEYSLYFWVDISILKFKIFFF